MDIGLVHTNLIYSRGAEKQLCELSYYLDKMGNDVTIYTFEKKENYVFDNLLKNINIVSLDKPWHINSNNILLSSVNVPRWYLMVKELSKKIDNHDILNLHNTPSNWISNYVDIKTVWTCNEPPYLTQCDKGINKYLLFPYRKLDDNLTNVDLICVLDARMKTIVSTLFSNPIKSIGSGASLFRQVHHEDNGYINIISVGPIVPQRHQYDIVKAVSRLNIPNLKVHFVGDIKDYNYHKNIVDLSSKNDLNVIFYGVLTNEKLYDLFDISDIAIMASIQPWGIFPLETFLANIPTITSNQVGINEFIDNKDFVFKMEDVNDLSSKILEVINNYDYFKSKTVEISRDVEENYTWEGYSKRVYSILNDIANR